jgi:hypothetical protein
MVTIIDPILYWYLLRESNMEGTKNVAQHI